MTIVVTLGSEHNRRGRWTAYVGDRAVCTTAQPLLDVAAVLLSEGAGPGASIVLMRGDVECLRSTIGSAARLTVVNDRFVRRPPGDVIEPPSEPGPIVPPAEFAMVDSVSDTPTPPSFSPYGDFELAARPLTYRQLSWRLLRDLVEAEIKSEIEPEA